MDERTKRENAEKEFDEFKSSIESYIPLMITSIDIANVTANGNILTDYGNAIYSSNTMYLKPRIKYTGIKSGTTITLYVRFYTASGTLSTGKSSPSGYSYSNNVTISSGSDNTVILSGWGEDSSGNWVKGSYRFEIWYGSMCLKSKVFTIY